MASTPTQLSPSVINSQQRTNVFVVGQNRCGEFGLNNDDKIMKLTAWNPPGFHMQSIQHINAGRHYFIITDPKQRRWCAGYNPYGQLGLGSDDNKVVQFEKNEYFEEKKQNLQIQRVFTSVSGYCTFWLTDDDRVYANGQNDSNQLGIQDKDSILEPMFIQSLSRLNIKDIKCGRYHCIALDANGTVYGTKYGGDEYNKWEQNGVNELEKFAESGFSALSFFCARKLVIKLIATGAWHSIFVDQSNGIWACGNNTGGQCGLGKDVKSTKKIGPQKISEFSDRNVSVSDVQCGTFHTLVLFVDGIVYAFGLNSSGPCGIGKALGETIYLPQIIGDLKDEKITQIKCGANHSYARSEKGRHYLFGHNKYNECSLQESQEDVIWTPLCINQRVCELTNGGRVVCAYLGRITTWIVTSFEVKHLSHF